jgi:mannose-1-phosphate guanylyltransferase
MKDNYVIIMAGGVGSRFWPYSRKNFPKQFHDVLGMGKSLIQLTADRFSDICPLENIYVVTNETYYDLVKEQLSFCGEDQILLEPEGKNTAPCVAYAAYKIHSKNPKANLIVCPSDHMILKEETYIKRIKEALELIKSRDVLVTLGIKPLRPDTGYGYINFEKSETIAKKVIQFKEKPNAEVAQNYLDSGDYVWNAGIFVWTTQDIIHSFKTYLPEIDVLFKSDLYYTASEKSFIEEIYPKCPSISIDYAILEKAANVEVILADIGWTDLGTWKSLYDVQDKDEHCNVIDGNVVVYDSTNCIIKTPKDRLVVVQGLHNFIVAEYENVLMVCSKDQEQMVKKFVEDLKSKKEESYY